MLTMATTGGEDAADRTASSSSDRTINALDEGGAVAADTGADVLASFPSPSYRNVPPLHPFCKFADGAPGGPLPPPTLSSPLEKNGPRVHIPADPNAWAGGRRSATAVDDDDCSAGLYVSGEDVRASIDRFKHLAQAAEAYIAQLTRAAAESAKLAQAFENVARQESGDSGDGVGLQACAGLQYLVANQLQILSEASKKAFVDPLKECCGEYENKLNRDEVEYRQTVAALGEAIRQTEGRSYKMGRRGKRDLSTFRNALSDITRQVEELDAVNYAYYRGVHETRALGQALALQSAAGLVRAEVEVFDRLAQKGFADPILEQIVQSVPDPFESCEPPPSASLFDALPPFSSTSAHRPRGPSAYAGPGEFSCHEGGPPADADADNAFATARHEAETVKAFRALFGATPNELLLARRSLTDGTSAQTDPDPSGDEWSKCSSASVRSAPVDSRNAAAPPGSPGERRGGGARREGDRPPSSSSSSSSPRQEETLRLAPDDEREQEEAEGAGPPRARTRLLPTGGFFLGEPGRSGFWDGPAALSHPSSFSSSATPGRSLSAPPSATSPHVPRDALAKCAPLSEAREEAPPAPATRPGT